MADRFARCFACLALLISTAAVAMQREEGVWVANSSDASHAIWKAIGDAMLAPHGTVYANVWIDAKGRAHPGDTFGTLQGNEAVLGIVREALPSLRFSVPSDRKGSEEGRPWVLFWVFQNHACEEDAFDVPRDVTVVRICIPADSTATSDQPSVRFELDRPLPKAEILSTGSAIDCHYPAESRRRGETGSVLAVFLVDARGRGTPLQVIQSSLVPRLDGAALGCLRRLRFAPWGGTAPGDGLVTVRWTWMLAGAEHYPEVTGYTPATAPRRWP